MKLNTLTLMFAGLVAGSTMLACGDKDGEDSGDDGTTDADTDADTDTDTDADTDTDTTEPPVSYFEPTSLLFEAGVGMKEGVMFDVTSGGTPLGSYFGVWLINDDWAGPDDTRNYCVVYFDTSAAATDSTCTDCWAGAAWTVDTSLLLGSDGECDDLDPELWGEDPVGDLAMGSYGFGFGPMSAKFAGTVEDAYAKYWADYGTNFLSNFIYTDLTGTGSWYEMNTAFVYGIDDDGELLVEGSGNVLLDVTDAAVAPDGFYSSSFFYGFTLGG